MRHKNTLRDIMREYEQIRSQTETQRDQRIEDIYRSIPRLAEIDQALKEQGLGLARIALSGDADKANESRATSAKLRKERHTLLEKNKISENYFTPDYRCNVCKDTGYTIFAPGIPANPCVCLKQSLIDEYYSLSNMKEILQEENFETFDIRLFSEETLKSEGLSPRQNMENNYRHATSFVQKFGKKFQNLLLYGKSGLGKTFICHCIAKDLLDEGQTVLYLTAPRLCKIIETHRFNRDSLSEPEEMLDTVDQVDLLILDDMGTEISTIITSAALFDIINQRLLMRKPTVISTNLTPDGLEAQYSERILSRFLGHYHMIKFFGEDIRAKKKYGGLRIS